MTADLGGRRARARRLPRRRVRVRLALLYAELFFIVGVALVGLTYALVDHSLSTAPGISVDNQAQVNPKLAVACKQGGVVTVPGKLGSAPTTTPVDRGLLQQCKEVFASGARLGASQKRSQALGRLLVYSLAALGLMTLAAGALGWKVAGRVLRPLQAITDAARRASEDNLDQRLQLEGPEDELKELADTFDAMLERLEASLASQRRFVANASHELRTPLTIMRAAVDVTLAKPDPTREQWEAMGVEIRQGALRADALVEALLTLARSDRAVGGQEFVDLATAAEDALDQARVVIRDRGVAVEVSLSSAETTGDRVLLERLVANLVDNAARHNVAGGWMRVATGRRQGSVFVEVSNSGPDIPEDVVPSLLEPFRRLQDRVDPDGGLGLGLSIVRSVTIAHHGQLRAHSRHGGGLEVGVSLPVPDPEPPGAAAPVGATAPAAGDVVNSGPVGPVAPD